jgi:hypothetical protein
VKGKIKNADLERSRDFTYSLELNHRRRGTWQSAARRAIALRS